ncbi:DUF535 family protein [Ramlibacter sp. MAHUQ-53]|uniref:DUF535 family protein n=1 Tax=unclassified Ramlibacter TaxID=2617605 RepID=UPI0036400ADC
MSVRMRFAARHLLLGPSLDRWYGHLRNTPSMADLPLLPMLLLQAQRPFYDHRLSTSERVRSLIHSHRLQHDLLGQGLYGRLLAGEERTVCTLSGRDTQPYRLTLSCEGRFLREGNITLSLWKGDDRYKALTFSLDADGGQAVCRVGGLQGMTQDALEKFRDATRDLHGLQPRTLVVEALRALCLRWGVGRIEAIATRNHSWNSLVYRVFKRAKQRHLRYDETWALVGGTPNARGNYDIPLFQEARPIEDYPSSKRAAIRRRRAVLDELRESLWA